MRRENGGPRTHSRDECLFIQPLCGLAAQAEQLFRRRLRHVCQKEKGESLVCDLVLAKQFWQTQIAMRKQSRQFSVANAFPNCSGDVANTPPPRDPLFKTWFVQKVHGLETNKAARHGTAFFCGAFPFAIERRGTTARACVRTAEGLTSCVSCEGPLRGIHRSAQRALLGSCDDRGFARYVRRLN